ncbi:MAG: preprotein translocase subunit SecA, partial [Pseudomonadota bacterium]
AVTIATNMAGRGTDIKLGGNTEVLVQQALKGDESPEQIEALRGKMRAQVDQDREKVKQLGGLFVIGSERHESRRIDNQLRGRSGRQGDPGRSKFFISLEDYLMSVFGAQQRLGPLLAKLNLKQGHAIVHPWINAAIERAQKKVEAMHFDNRKYLLKRDNVLNEQRLVIYKQRREIMEADNVTETIAEMRHEAIREAVRLRIPANSYAESWEIEELTKDAKRLLNLDLPLKNWAEEDGIGREDIRDRYSFADRIRHASRTS